MVFDSSSSTFRRYTYNIPITASASSTTKKKNAIVPASQQKPIKNNKKKSKDAQKEQKQQCVCFYQKVKVYEHIHHNDLTYPEHSSFWWHREDYEDSRIESENTVALMDKQGGFNTAMINNDNSTKGICYRGLEKRTKIGRKNMMCNRKVALDVINKEVTRQYIKDIFRKKLDCDKLAKAYKQKTDHCMKQARQMAIQDEEFVLREHYGLNMKRIQQSPSGGTTKPSLSSFWKSPPPTPRSSSSSGGQAGVSQHHRRTFHGLAA